MRQYQNIHTGAVVGATEATAGAYEMNPAYRRLSARAAAEIKSGRAAQRDENTRRMIANSEFSQKRRVERVEEI